MFWSVRARLGYWVARRLLAWRWLVKQPRAWAWMQGQYARMAALGDVAAQSFYGHLLLFRGQGLGAREEGLRLLRLAAQGADAKAAYQLGVQALAGSVYSTPDAQQAVYWWQLAEQAGHALAAQRLSVLYREGAPDVLVDCAKAQHYQMRAEQLGMPKRSD